MKGLRIGQGFDVHRFAEGRSLWLCGVQLESDIGLLGHSDADVALHALTDAILGAVAAGDIGDHFPPSDARWRDAGSSLFVKHALDLAGRDGWKIVNCDLTIIGERPKIAPLRDRLRQSVAAIAGLDLDAVSVKATTTEGLGLTGRGEGLAAMAVVLMGRDHG